MRNHSDYFSSTCTWSCPFLHHLRGIKQTCNLKFKQSSRLNVIGGCCRRRLQAKLFCFSTFKHTHTHITTDSHATSHTCRNSNQLAGRIRRRRWLPVFKVSPLSRVHCPLSGGNSILAAHTQHTHIHDVLCATKSINSLFCCCVFCCPAGRF